MGYGAAPAHAPSCSSRDSGLARLSDGSRYNRAYRVLYGAYGFRVLYVVYYVELHDLQRINNQEAEARAKPQYPCDPGCPGLR